VHMSCLPAGRASQPSEGHDRRDRSPPSIGPPSGRLSADAPSRRREDGLRCAPSRSDQDAAAPGSGGAGPGLCPE